MSLRGRITPGGELLLELIALTFSNSKSCSFPKHVFSVPIKEKQEKKKKKKKEKGNHHKDKLKAEILLIQLLDSKPAILLQFRAGHEN